MIKTIWNCLNYRNYSKSNSWRNLEKSNPPQPSQAPMPNHQSRLNEHTPSDWEKKILVFSGRYKSVADIPKHVPLETLDKAKSMLRIRIANLMMVCTLCACAYFAWSGKQKAKQGDSIRKRVLERDEKMLADYRGK